KGGASKADEAGFVIVGGHTIEDKEPKYGMAVTGLIRPGQQVTNAAARPGDQLILTKPLGIGIITTALKAGQAREETIQRVIAVMSALNKVASEVMVRNGIRAATDVTGFGLLGHLYEMTQASGVGARVFLSQVPVLEEAWGMVEEGLVPGGTWRNLEYLRPRVSWGQGVSDNARLVLCDAQTSGGLLLVAPKEKSQPLRDELSAAGVEAALIGEIIADKRIEVLR
ncbi:MAG: selenide, water dikinase SelD, partial [Chloroflexota bacterium]|nr:selenide, water dikinase SelD [Chloroflexota bacterium]